MECSRISWAVLWVLVTLFASPWVCHAQQEYRAGNIATGYNWYRQSDSNFYQDWATATHLFVNDSIRFDYDTSQYDVTILWGKDDLLACNITNVATSLSVSTTIIYFPSPGDYYFMSAALKDSGVSADCLAGMSFVMSVLEPGDTPPPSAPPPPDPRAPSLAPGPAPIGDRSASPGPPPPAAASPGISLRQTLSWGRQTMDYPVIPSTIDTVLAFDFASPDDVYTILEVTQADYDSCTRPSKPLATYSNRGTITVTLIADGVYYFIDALPENCLAGNMKVTVVVGGFSVAQPPQTAQPSTTKFPIAAVVVPCVIVFVLGFAIVVFLYCRHHYPRGRYEERHVVTSGTARPRTWFTKSGENSAAAISAILQGQTGGTQCTVFAYEELERATKSFSSDAEVGSGGFGTVYKGTLDDGRTVAIKMAKHANDVESFVNEVSILSGVNNRNLVKLLGCCVDMDIPLLVYEFVPNGNLQDHLYKAHKAVSAHLPWNLRFKIALQTAEALKYLHVQATPPIFHRDVKSANILLDYNYNAKVADFGFSKLVDVEATHVSTLVKGTPGYLDPEYYFNSQLTDKSDVYSFGVVLLELITSKKPIDLSKPEGGQNLAVISICLIKAGKFRDIIDTQVSSNLSTAQFQEVEAVAKVAAACLVPTRALRPSMTEVLEMLQRIKKSQLKAEEFYGRSDNQSTRIEMKALASLSGNINYSAGGSSEGTSQTSVSSNSWMAYQ